MDKKEIMTRAWEIRKTDKVSMSVALVQAWAESKAPAIEEVWYLDTAIEYKEGRICVARAYLGNNRMKDFTAGKVKRYGWAPDGEAPCRVVTIDRALANIDAIMNERYVS